LDESLLGECVFNFWRGKNTMVDELLEEREGTGFSMARYEPMARLMSDEDLHFLKAQPGYNAEIGKKFSRERRRIFRLYLRELGREFNRLHASARVAVASMPAEQAPLVGILLRQQVRFWYEMAAVEMQLALKWTGLGAIDARGLVEAISVMHAEVSRLAAPTAA
jgi:hypothetical protein